MNNPSFIDSNLFIYLIIPLAIFIARVLDVSLGTIRIMMISKGEKYIAAAVSFFEILIWITAISQIIKNYNNFACYLGYAAGFSIGTFVGISIEKKLSIGTVILRTIAKKQPKNLIKHLKNKKCGVTVIEGKGLHGDVKIVFSVLRKADLPQALQILKKELPKAFYSISDIKSVNKGVFPINSGKFKNKNLFSFTRKGK